MIIVLKEAIDTSSPIALHHHCGKKLTKYMRFNLP
jgi:hypothetical protein